MKFTLKKGMQYCAQIHLTGFEVLASNEQISGLLRDVGFVDIVVTGNGEYRRGSATWPRADRFVILPSEISDIELIGSTLGGGKATENETGGGAA